MSQEGQQRRALLGVLPKNLHELLVAPLSVQASQSDLFDLVRLISSLR